MPWRGWARGAAGDAVLAASLALGAFVPGSGVFGVRLGESSSRPLDLTGALLVLGQCLPLAARRRSPAACLAVVATAFALHQLLAHPTSVAGLGLLVALYSAGAHQERSRTATATAATAAYAALAWGLHLSGSPASLGGVLALSYFSSFYLVLVAAWAAGAWVRARAREETARRQEDAQRAVAGERARIARELHDVVTHHVTAMVVQAEAAQRLLHLEPARAAASVSSVSDTGRAALADLRHLLGVLHAPEEAALVTASDRSPAVRPVAELVDRARAAGQEVELVEEAGDQRPAADGVQLAAYRVVQEGLTNALKHAPGAPVLVRVDQREGGVDVEVTTGTPGNAPAGMEPSHGSWPGAGRGLTGLRERVDVLGGELLAGPRPGGGFILRASIPDPVPRPVPASVPTAEDR